MGINACFEPLLTQLAERTGLSGVVCTLGAQDVPEGDNPNSYFSRLGFSAVESLDISDHEGASHIFDLNNDELPPHLIDRFDAVFNGGTLEHIFHIPNALTSITRMLRPGGTVIHIVPCNGWMDHGFYQISPTLMFDYYEAAGYEILESALYSQELSNCKNWRVWPISAGDLGDSARGSAQSGSHLYLFAARRRETAIERPRPIQQLYSGLTTVRSRPRWFTPYTVGPDAWSEFRVKTKIELTNMPREVGCCWAAHIPKFTEKADCVAHPTRSTLFVMENNEILSPAHSIHQKIRQIGRGAYSHWNETLYFSTSDNSDPNLNGRCYTAIIFV